MSASRAAIAFGCLTLLWSASGGASATDGSSVGLEAALEGVRGRIRDGDYADARERARTLLREVESSHGAESLEAAAVLHELVEAERLVGMLGHVPGVELAQRALSIREAHLGPEHPDVARSAVRLGRMMTDYGKGAAAREGLEKALSRQEAIFGPDAPELLEALEALGNAIEQSGAIEAARPFKERALRIAEDADPPRNRDVATALHSLATNLTKNGDYDPAKPLFARALEIRERELGPEHPDVALTLTNQGVLAFDTDDGETARRNHERALAIGMKRLGPEHPQVARSHGNLGNLERAAGNLAEAVRRYEIGLSILENALGASHPDVARALTSMGGAVAALGDDARALRLLERALEVSERAFGPDHPRVANTLNDLGNLRRKLADYDGAQAAYERSVGIYERVMGTDNIEVTWPLRNLAALLAYLGDFETSRRNFARVYEIRSRTYGADSPRLLGEKADLAGLTAATGDLTGARTLYEEVLAAEEKADGAESLGLPFTLVPLADILWRQGDEADAEKLLRRALALEERRYGPDNPMLAPEVLRLARIEAKTGRKAEAMTGALRAAAIAREHLRMTTSGLSEREALRFAAVRRGALDLVLSLALESGRAPDVEAAIDALVRTRAIVLDEMARRHAQGGSDPEVVALRERLASARQDLARLTVRPPDGTPEEVASRIRSALDARDKAERELAERSESFRVERLRDEAGLREAVTALPGEAALLGFARFELQRFDATKRGAAGLLALPSYVAFVAAPDRPATLVFLGPAGPVEELVASIRDNIASLAIAPNVSTKRATKAYTEIGSRLREAIWDPAWRGAEPPARVWIVPDGALGLVNFSALPVAGSSYLVEKGPIVHYVSAERDLIGPEESARGSGFLAVGDPAFDLARGGGASGPSAYRGSRSTCRGFSEMRFDPLPASAVEVAELTDLWNRMADSGRMAAEARRLTGTAASEAELKRSAQGQRVLHLATHGFFLGQECVSVVEDNEGARLDAPRTKPVGENPLLLSGLALAGANQRDKAGPDGEDGILTAEEIASLDLTSVEWAVLSACDTGVGAVSVGEGLLGLRRAFQVAGARTVITSLWPVEDETARRWMRELYEAHFERGLSTAEATRAANVKVLETRRAEKLSTHPFFWAAFVAAGDWR